jgi:nucleoside triphosphate pyrophosphatase
MKTVILASASVARREMLHRAGVSLTVVPANVDEDGVKNALRAEAATASQAAETLAELKAAKVSAQHGEALVLGADQMLDCAGQWFDKPTDRAAAAWQLRALSGQRHTLATGVCLMRGGSRIWHRNETAHLTMRLLSNTFIEGYLDAAGDDATSTVGAYRLEGVGAQLFTAIEGDFFTILGLPLLPVLDVLRTHGMLPS